MSIERHERLLEQMAALQMLAFKWMDAHDKLKAGKPYDLPTPADLPDALTTIQDREATLIRERDALREIISFADEALIPVKGEWAKQTRENIAKQLEALGTSGLVEP